MHMEEAEVRGGLGCFCHEDKTHGGGSSFSSNFDD